MPKFRILDVTDTEVASLDAGDENEALADYVQTLVVVGENEDEDPDDYEEDDRDCPPGYEYNDEGCVEVDAYNDEPDDDEEE